MSSKNSGEKVKVGDTFNETDEEELHRVVEIKPDSDPPVAICRTVKADNESDSTDMEYALAYVEDCVAKLKEFHDKGLDTVDVYDIYQMSRSELIASLKLVKQNTKGSKTQLRDRLCSYRQIGDIPSDASGGDEKENADGEETDDSVSELVKKSRDDDDAYTEPSSSSESDGSDSDEDYVPKKKSRKVSSESAATSSSSVTDTKKVSHVSVHVPRGNLED